MSRPRLLLAGLAGAAPGEVLALSEREIHRLRRVLRLEAGARVGLFDGHGRQGEGELTATASGLGVAVLARDGDGDGEGEGEGDGAGGPAPAAARLTLAVSAPKGPRAAWLVEKATELGVAEVAWVVAARSQPHSRAPALGAGGRLGRLAEAAARQSGAAHLPRLVPPSPLVAWLRQWRASCPEAAAFVCHPGAEEPTTWPGGGGPRAVLVGPEGGLTDEEVALARAAHFVPLRLSQQILRVETAAIVAAARLT